MAGNNPKENPTQSQSEQDRQKRQRESQQNQAGDNCDQGAQRDQARQHGVISAGPSASAEPDQGQQSQKDAGKNPKDDRKDKDRRSDRS